jgi:hypothetical protein
VAQRVLELAPDFLPAHLSLWRSREAMGQVSQAFDSFEAALCKAGLAEVASEAKAHFAATGYASAMGWAADRLRAGGPDSSLPAEVIAMAFLADGQVEAAVEVVAGAVQRKAPIHLWAAIAPDWDPIREHPRFREVVGLPPPRGVE